LKKEKNCRDFNHGLAIANAKDEWAFGSSSAAEPTTGKFGVHSRVVLCSFVDTQPRTKVTSKTISNLNLLNLALSKSAQKHTIMIHVCIAFERQYYYSYPKLAQWDLTFVGS
jgi:hypothetical protein